MNCAMMKDWQRRAGRHLFGAMTVESQSLVIIGGSSGMGLAIAKKAVQAGATVTIAARSRAKLDEAREAIAADVTTHTVDVSEEQSVKTLFSKIGPFDHLVAPVVRSAVVHYANSRWRTLALQWTASSGGNTWQLAMRRFVREAPLHSFLEF